MRVCGTAMRRSRKSARSDRVPRALPTKIRKHDAGPTDHVEFRRGVHS